ncbi:MAG: T9SS type A sorting domain-containing protein [Bacteroidia bacterium]
MEKHLSIISALLFFVLGNSTAQTFQKTYGGTNGDSGSSVQQTSDGGYVITGSATNFGAGNTDVYLIKTDAGGNTLWTKTFGGTDVDVGNSVQQTADGGYVIAGTTWSFGAGINDVYLIKTNSVGDTLWTKTFGGTNIDFGSCVQQTADGGYIIAGHTQSFGAGLNDVYLIKTDSVGDTLWTKTFGGTSDDLGSFVKQTADGGYIIAGQTLSFVAGNRDVYIIKTNAFGDTLWTKSFGIDSTESGHSIQQTSDGGYIIVGRTLNYGVGNTDVYLIKTDTGGNTLWTKTFGDTLEDEYGQSVQQTSDGGYIIAGRTTANNWDVLLIKTDAGGNSLWTKTFGGNGQDNGFSVQETADGGYIIAANTTSFGAGYIDVYLIKTDSLGNSGCNEGSPPIIVTTPASIIGTPATIVTSPATIVTSPATIVGSGGNGITLCTTVGINEIVWDNYFIISPNPSAGNFILSFEEKVIKGTVKILNILGENLFAENIFNESKKEINLQNISAGIYLVKVDNGEKQYTEKVIIK